MRPLPDVDVLSGSVIVVELLKVIYHATSQINVMYRGPVRLFESLKNSVRSCAEDADVVTDNTRIEPWIGGAILAAAFSMADMSFLLSGYLVSTDSVSVIISLLSETVACRCII